MQFSGVEVVQTNAFADSALRPPWLLSGTSEIALRDSAGRLWTHLDGTPDVDPLDVGYSLATARTHFPHRAVVLAQDPAGYREALAALANGKAVTGVAKAGRRIAFLFAGEGGQRVHMGRELYPVFKVFADALDEVCAHLEKNSGWPVRNVLLGSGLPQLDPVDQELFTQDALFALQVALFRLFEHWGLRPDFVVGHSFGELAAATVAGVFSLPDVTALMAERARLLHATMPAGGAMVAMRVSEEDIRDSLAGHEHAVRVSAVNSPSAVVISGDREAVREIAGMWASRGRKVKELPVTRAFHSPHVDAMAAGFAQFMRGLSRATPEIPVVPIHHGRIIEPDTVCVPDYWEAQMRGTGRFLDCVRTLESAGVDTYVELSANGTLASLVEECLSEEAAGEALATAALRGGGQSDLQAVLGMLAQVHVHGVPVDWAAVFSGWGGRRVHLPTAGFQQSQRDPGPKVATPDALSTRQLLELVRTEAADILEHATSEDVRPDDSFLDLGIDSLGGVELVKRLKAATGLHLTAPVIFSHPTPASLAGYLYSRALRNVRPAMEDTPPVDMAPANRAALMQRLEALTNDQIFALIDEGFDAA